MSEKKQKRYKPSWRDVPEVETDPSGLYRGITGKGMLKALLIFIGICLLILVIRACP